MKAKRNNVCQECRAKKLACDGAQPECHQCSFRRIRCSGYKQEFLFVSDTTARARLYTKGANKGDIVSTDSVLHPVLPAGRSAIEATKLSGQLEDDVQFIVQHYAPAVTKTSGEARVSHNQICGAWVEILPFLARTRRSDQPLVPAIRTLATALRHHDLNGDAFQPQILEMYCESLRHVGKALIEAKDVFSLEHCAAIMCLSVTDIVTPRLKSGWMTHANAVGKMLQDVGPRAFSGGMMHVTFVGFRPLLIISSILSRRGTFLAREDWVTKPFEGRSVAPIQLLMNKACELPALLQAYDNIGCLSDASNLDTVAQLASDFRALLTDYRNWHRTVHSQASSPLVWLKFDPEIWLLSSAKALWFPDIVTANSLTHYWAFEIIVRMHLSTLDEVISTAKGCDAPEEMPVSTGVLGETSLLSLADMICDSIPYLLQPEMKLHGLGSAFFILPLAMRVYKNEPDLSSARVACCQRVADLLASRGFLFD